MEIRRPGRMLPAAVCLVAAFAQTVAATSPPEPFEWVSAARVPVPRPEAGVFVLDLDGLESAAAAQDLVESWRQRRPQGGAPACWLLGQRREELRMAALRLTHGISPSCGKVFAAERRR